MPVLAESNPNTNQKLNVQSNVPHPRSLPFEAVLWPSHKQVAIKNLLQQVKSFAKPQSVSGTPSLANPVSPAKTLPKTANIVGITQRILPGGAGQKAVSVQFQQTNPNDPYFSSVNIYTQQAGKPPVLVASGATSPVTFKAVKSSAPTVILVQSVGNWGSTDLKSSPTKSIRL